MDGFLEDAADTLRLGGLRDADQQHFEAVFSALDAFAVALAKAQLDLTNFEEAFAAFEMAELLGISQEANLSRSMCRLIARTLDNKITFPIGQYKGNPRAIMPSSEYDKLAVRLKEMESFPTVITFNYDCALDFACYYHDIPINYGLLGNTPVGDELPLLKLHGSLNWRTQVDSGEIYPVGLDTLVTHWNDYLRGVRRGSQPSVTLPFSAAFVDGEFLGRQLGPDPMLVPPTWNKTAHQGQIAPVWKLAADAFAQAEHIYIVGYSLPASDHFFRHLYALGSIGSARIRKFAVFNPDKTVRGRFEELLGQLVRKKFDFTPDGLDAAVAQL